MSAALNPAQRAAVEHHGGPLLVLAGAGTGKTRVLVHRIAALVERGVPPWEILAVTFTNKAAQEMRERLVHLLGGRARPMWIGTFHAVCARLLRRWGERIGLARDFQIFDDDDQMKIVGQLLKDEGCDDAISARTLLVRFDRAKNKGIDPVSVKTGQYVDEFVEKIFPRYQERLRRENAVDFNDILLNVLRLFDDEEVGPKLSLLFGHVLVDEFQDTNRVQYSIACQLAAATRNITGVGDDDQSIYGWRGAEPKNLFDFERDFPEATLIRLEQNYRSTSVILDAANAVIDKNVQRHRKNLWTERGGGDPIVWYEAGDDRGEAWFVADRIRKFIEEEGLSPRDIAILYRTHSQSRSLEEQLRRVGFVPEIIGGISFYDRKEVKDVLAYLRLLVNPASDTSFERVVNVPARGIGDGTVEKLRKVARERDVPLLEAARRAYRDGHGLAAAARKRLHVFVDLMDGIAAVQNAGASVAEVLIQIIERSGYRQQLEAEDSEESRQRLSNLAELVTVAADYDDELAGGEEPATVTGFLERLALATPGDAIATPEGHEAEKVERVRMTTVHAAKGLEFPVVFLCGMEDGLFPSLRERDDQDEQASLEEERRLAYVAITRARNQLFLTAARTRRVWGEIRFQTPSRFVDDIPPACMARPRRPAPAPARVPGTIPVSLQRPERPPARPKRAMDEHDQRSWDDADEPSYDLDGDRSAPKTRGDRLGPGSRVEHVQFGVGRVVDAQGEGRDRKLLIDFPEVGHKTVLARFVTPA